MVLESREDDVFFVESEVDRRWALTALVSVLIMIVVVLGAIGQSIDEAAVPSATSVVRGDAPVRPDRQPSNWLSTWPDPPADHAPIVSGTPVTDHPLGDGLPGHTLIYVNSIDRPTVIDLVRGGRQELTISSERARDRFLVEDGHVVDSDSLNPDLPTAGDGAIPIFVHRSVNSDTVDLSEPLPYAGPHLCLDRSGCDGAWRYSSTLRSGDQQVMRVTIDSDPALAQILDPSTMDTTGRFYIVADRTGEQVKVPVPRTGTPVWLISDIEGPPSS